MDEKMELEVKALEIPSKCICSGNPHLADIIAKNKKQKTTNEGVNGVTKLRFISEPIKEYLSENHVNQYTIFKSIYNNLMIYKFSNINLIIRPHPKEKINNWMKFICKGFGRNINVELDRTPFDKIHLNINQVVIGISSMALIELRIKGVPVFSYQIDVPKNYYNIPFDKYGIKRIKNINELNDICSGKIKNTEIPKNFIKSHINSLTFITTHIEKCI